MTLLHVVLLLLLVVMPSIAHGTSYAPNHFLGTCLTDDWVLDVETKLSISAHARDAQMRLLHPHLHAALKHRRYTINDPRTCTKPMSALYRPGCGPSFTFWGVNATVDPSTGAVTDQGVVNGSLVVEIKGWASHQLSTMVFAILAREVLGYDVSFLKSSDQSSMGQRMAPSDTGLCTPVHVNVEEWGRKYDAYVDDIYKTNAQAYAGRTGLYTTTKFVKNGADATKYTKVFDADFWRAYTRNDELIDALSVDILRNNADYYPPQENGCPDGKQGCQNACSRTDTCTQREEVDKKDCMVVILMYYNYDDAWTEAVMANNKIPSYHCFLGWAAVEKYAVEMEAKDVPVVFYHYEPDPFHIKYAGKFQRIFLPRTTPEVVDLNTGLFGENGYGKQTNNPISVDYQMTALSIYASSFIQDHDQIAMLLSRYSLQELHMNSLLRTLVDIQDHGATAIQPDDFVFSSACKWVRENYRTWKLWLGRLPVCNIFTDLSYSFEHCGPSDPQLVVFQWKEPNPTNPDQPDTCDPGVMTKPPGPIETSRSCEWLKANALVWFAWLFALPPCDASFFAFHLSTCDAHGKRTATYHWLLPDPTNSSLSRECVDGETLPAPVTLQCEYTPHSSTIFAVVLVIALLVATVLLFMIGFVIRHRAKPIIKRSQYEFLVMMIVGGITMCGAALVYAGEPTNFLCAARPAVTSIAFTLIFGSLVIKSLRVYRVFMSGAMKRVVLSTKSMFKIQGVFLCVDVLILSAWFGFDFPLPDVREVEVGALNGGVVLHHVCMSSSFIFTALLIFWKAIVLLMGLYLSFLIRNVSTDFQESIWIFASSVVVLFGSLIILPMAYLVELPASVFYAFLSLMLLGCTALVMGMMLVPKITRLHEKSSDRTSVEKHSNHSRGGSSEYTGGGVGSTSSPGRVNKIGMVRLPSKARIQVTPVEAFKPAEAMTKKSEEEVERGRQKKKKKSSTKRKGNVTSDSD